MNSIDKEVTDNKTVVALLFDFQNQTMSFIDNSAFSFMSTEKLEIEA